MMKLPAVSAIEWTAIGDLFFQSRHRNLAEQLIDRNHFWKSIQDFLFLPTFDGQLWSCHSILPAIGGQSFASLLSQHSYDLSQVLLAGHSYVLYPHDVYGMVYRFSDEDRAYYFVKPERLASDTNPEYLYCVVVTTFAERVRTLGLCGSYSHTAGLLNTSKQ